MERKLEAIGNAQLVIDLAQVVLDHLLRGPKLKGNGYSGADVGWALI
jgi:hypothetical protein